MKDKKYYLKKNCKGSMTLEASLILPVFLLLFMNLISLIEIYRIHGNIMATLWEEGRKAAKYSYLETVSEEVWQKSDADMSSGTVQSILAGITIRRKIEKNLNTYPLWERHITGGKDGIIVSSDFNQDGNGIIKLDCSYQIHPIFGNAALLSGRIKNHYYGHGWTGYCMQEYPGEEGESEEIYVYITETGTVYHKNRGCSYLNPSISSVPKEELQERRNQSGAIYYACPLCTKNITVEGAVYITEYGTNYHTSTGCSGLKRTIYEVKLSEAGGRGPCSKCGGG